MNIFMWYTIMMDYHLIILIVEFLTVSMLTMGSKVQ